MIEGEKIFGGGRLVFGQELDSEDGLFSKVQGFSGDLADIILVNDLLSVEDARDYTSCQLDMSKYAWLFSLEDNVGNLEAKGSFLFFNVTNKEICEKREFFALPYPTLLTFSRAKQHCNSISGHLFAPANEYEDRILDLEFLDILDICSGSFSTNYWLGVEADLSQREWVNSDTKLSLKHSNFAELWGDIEASHQCVTKGYYFQGWWYKTPCDMTACPVCAYVTSPIIIYGLCAKTLINTELYLETIRNANWCYLGKFDTKLLWRNSTWEMTNNDENTRLEMVKSDGLLPLGRHDWIVEEDKCMVNRVSVRQPDYRKQQIYKKMECEVTES